MEDFFTENRDNIDTIIFTMSRMNPPTPGHLFLIENLIREGIKKNTQKVYVILSKTNDNNEDPISCVNKIDVLGNIDDINSMTQKLKQQMIEQEDNVDTKQKIEDIDVVYICVKPEQKSPFSPLYDIINSYPQNIQLNLFMIIGDDRKELLDSIVSTFLFNDERIKSVDGLILDRPSMGRYKNMSKSELQNLNISDVPVGAFSASFVRNLVKYDLRDKFDDVYKNYLSSDKIDNLYNQVKDGLLLKDKKSKSSSKPAVQKYIYPLIKGTENYINALQSKTLKRKREDISGGKKNKKTKKNKKNKKISKKNKLNKKLKYKTRKI